MDFFGWETGGYRLARASDWRAWLLERSWHMLGQSVGILYRHIFGRHAKANFVYNSEESSGVESLNRTLRCGRRYASSRQR